MLLVTTPSEATRFVVSKTIRLARESGTDVALVANMTEHTCPSCGHESHLFGVDGVRRLAEESGAPLWASIPFDPRFGIETDRGTPLVITDPGAPSSRALLKLADRVAARIGSHSS